jgi:hypothetical protein
MPGFDGTRPRGLGAMTGRGRGYCVITLNPPEQEPDFLRNQAQVLRQHLKQIETTIKELEHTESEVGYKE